MERDWIWVGIVAKVDYINYNYFIVIFVKIA